MSRNMEDIARRNITEYVPPANGRSAPADPEVSLANEIRRNSVERERAAYAQRMAAAASAQAEAEALKAENDLEEERDRQEVRRQERETAAKARREAQAASGGGGMETIVGMFSEMWNATQARLAEMEGSRTTAMQAELAANRELMQQLLTRPAADPLDTVRGAFTLMQELQKLAPQRAEQRNWTPKETIDFEVKMAEIKLAGARTDMEREKFQAELEDSRGKRDTVMGFLGMLGERFADEGAKKVGEITTTIEQQAPAKMMHPWTCPNEECKGQNMAEPGQQVGYCAHCKLRVVLHHPGQTMPPEATATE